MACINEESFDTLKNILEVNGYTISERKAYRGGYYTDYKISWEEKRSKNMFVVNYYDEGMKIFHKKENVQTELISYYVKHVLPDYIDDAGNGRIDNTVEGAYRDVYEDLNSILDCMGIPYVADVTEVEEFSD